MITVDLLSSSTGPAGRSSSYVPAAVESYVIEKAQQLGYDADGEQLGCRIWNNASTSTIHSQLMEYRRDLEDYTARVKAFRTQIADLRLRVSDDECRLVDLHPNGLRGIFQKSHQLSWTPSSGYVEPLLPPMRHPIFCEQHSQYLLDLNYLVHDFGTMCRNLKRTSRIVLVDMGASLQFHGKEDSPALYLINLFHRFGLPFDHIYAFELKPTEPAEVYQKLPPPIMSAYHWINLGVSVEPGNVLNPFTTIKKNFNRDDLIIVKLDIDTPHLEMALAQQLMEDRELSSLIDHFYFEHHVGLKELLPNWGSKVQGTIKESLELFNKLRQKGISAHFWV
ncbi:hypothetical protein FisN_39Hu012 [Fistulifera solaris]|uniref:Methyltransferase FkbM domain-containing protein n=1 Tax=Fistulifera solaris TaxID=1519565 RepID=A0A1Z5KAK3_FISSO|nr:hypothetical protein FisN_39Hu012 [Fistulifera solaris]|eukprot:GAX23192.1 hypothetical protein FisN_39Hu012 [Fistulifera solaris]